VRDVLLDRSGYTPRIWTVIVTPPFDRAQREPVFRAELDAMREYPGVEVDFRLVNLAEYQGHDPRSRLPRITESLFENFSYSARRRSMS
jgi:hypothetical protein